MIDSVVVAAGQILELVRQAKWKSVNSRRKRHPIDQLSSPLGSSPPFEDGIPVNRFSAGQAQIDDVRLVGEHTWR